MDKLQAKTMQQQNREAKSDEDLRRWAVEQALKKNPTDPQGTTNTALIETAKKIEDYVRGRITTP